MATKRILITGGPGSGKTALIRFLEELDYPVMHEISRQIILEAQQKGIEQLFLKDPVLFSSRLLEARLQQYHGADQLPVSFVFYDRGLPDILAYLNYSKTEFENTFLSACQTHRYDAVFILPPWKSIYRQDNERYETYEQAVEIYTHLRKTYRELGYSCKPVPPGSLQERSDFILEKLKTIL